MLTEKDYCDYDISYELWVMGLKPEAYYDGPLILLYEAQTFLREEKDIHIEIDRIGYLTGYAYQVSVIEMEHNLCKFVINNNNTYEEALSEGIKESIKILKKK